MYAHERALELVSSAPPKIPMEVHVRMCSTVLSVRLRETVLGTRNAIDRPK